ncbi:MAG: hypothetical protein JW991_03610 [Candidatus Pacebacteria bacterium]|nr:hypothetical protein [Candidatus Paceibacterota bacterium]
MKKLIKTAGVLALAALPLITAASPVLADDLTFNISPSDQFASLGNISLPRMIRSLIVLALVIAAMIAFGFLIYGGIQWITSGGDKGKTEAARNTITAALVGLLIVFGSWAIIQLIQMFFGVSLLQLNLSDLSVAS